MRTVRTAAPRAHLYRRPRAKLKLGTTHRSRLRGPKLKLGTTVRRPRRARVVEGAVPRVRGPELTRLRGHASLADLQRHLSGGHVELLTIQGLRGRAGRFTRVDFLATLDSGETVEFTLTGARALDPDTIASIRAAIDAGGGPDRIRIVGSPPDLVLDLAGGG